MFLHLLIRTHGYLKYFTQYHSPIIFNEKLFNPLYFIVSIFKCGCNDNSEHERKTSRYWLIDNITQLLEEADKLYYEENYMAVYETLNRLKYQDNIEVQWRICRVLFKMSSSVYKEKSVKEHIIVEAYDLIQKTIRLNQNHSEAHKWLAIILDHKASLEGTYTRILTSQIVYDHLKKSLELNPEDPALLHMMGIWCFQISKLTWIKRQIAKYVFNNPSPTTLDEAYKYFLKAEQIKPRFFLGNMYMLGVCSYQLGMYYRARYYLQIAAELPTKSEIERIYSEKAKKMSDWLGKYEIDVNALL